MPEQKAPVVEAQKEQDTRSSITVYPVKIKSWRMKGIACLRIAFGFIWLMDASLKWSLAFQQVFVTHVVEVSQGQPPLIHAWLSFWIALLGTHPLIFARLENSVETALALSLLFGIFSNASYVLGMLLAFGIWSVGEGFGGPYYIGHNTDIGSAITYVIVFGLLFCVSAGRYYAFDIWLTPRLGPFGVLAAGKIRPEERSDEPFL